MRVQSVSLTPRWGTFNLGSNTSGSMSVRLDRHGDTEGKDSGHCCRRPASGRETQSWCRGLGRVTAGIWRTPRNLVPRSSRAEGEARGWAAMGAAGRVRES